MAMDDPYRSIRLQLLMVQPVTTENEEVRKANDGNYYFLADFEAWYGVQGGRDRWANAPRGSREQAEQILQARQEKAKKVECARLRKILGFTFGDNITLDILFFLEA